MAHTPRPSALREMRLPEVARQYKSGTPLYRIAESLNVHPSRITRDLQLLHERWLASADKDYHACAVRELATLDVMEQEYWQAWLASKADDEMSMSAQKGESREVWVRKRRRCGDPAYLDGVMNCVRERCKLLGLYAGSNLPRWRSVGLTAGGGDGAGQDQPVSIEREIARLNADLDDWARSQIGPGPDQLPPGFQAPD